LSIFANLSKQQYFRSSKFILKKYKKNIQKINIVNQTAIHKNGTNRSRSTIVAGSEHNSFLQAYSIKIINQSTIHKMVLIAEIY